MLIAQQIIWRRILEKYDKNFKYTYFGKQFDWISLLDVYFFHKSHNVHATNTWYNKRKIHIYKYMMLFIS